MTSPSRQRADAARLLRRIVTDGRTTDQVLAGREIHPLTQELVLGSLRHFLTLEAIVTTALHSPIKAKDRDVWFLMVVGVYQLRYLRVPDHAAIHETVAACDDLRKSRAKGLVNGVLRAVTRQPSADVDANATDHPPWLATALRASYADADDIMRANNQRAPMALRVNLLRSDVNAAIEQLEAAGLSVRSAPTGGGAGVISLGAETLVLREPCPVSHLPGHASGAVSVQDAGAQYAAPLLAPDPGERVLDACAAPGGKLFHLLERYPDTEATALERQPERLRQTLAQAERLGHHNFVALAGDAETLDWWDERPFRGVLLDAPCSGTGTLRRHPDIKLLRRPGEIAGFAALQQRLLRSLWRVLEPGGTLLYCTCSILAAENDEVVADFLDHQQDATAEPLRLASGRATRHGWQLLPTDSDTDGFYYARMTKGAA